MERTFCACRPSPDEHVTLGLRRWLKRPSRYNIYQEFFHQYEEEKWGTPRYIGYDGELRRGGPNGRFGGLAIVFIAACSVSQAQQFYIQCLCDWLVLLCANTTSYETETDAGGGQPKLVVIIWHWHGALLRTQAPSLNTERFYISFRTLA